MKLGSERLFSRGREAWHLSRAPWVLAKVSSQSILQFPFPTLLYYSYPIASICAMLAVVITWIL
jgi:hypothetical protein